MTAADTSHDYLSRNTSTPAPGITALHHSTSHISRSWATQREHPSTINSQHHITAPTTPHVRMPHKTGTPAPGTTALHHSTNHIARRPAIQHEHHTTIDQNTTSQHQPHRTIMCHTIRAPHHQKHSTTSQYQPHRTSTRFTTRASQHQKTQHHITVPQTWHKHLTHNTSIPVRESHSATSQYQPLVLKGSSQHVLMTRWWRKTSEQQGSIRYLEVNNLGCNCLGIYNLESIFWGPTIWKPTVWKSTISGHQF